MVVQIKDVLLMCFMDHSNCKFNGQVMRIDENSNCEKSKAEIWIRIPDTSRSSYNIGILRWMSQIIEVMVYAYLDCITNEEHR